MFLYCYYKNTLINNIFGARDNLENSITPELNETRSTPKSTNQILTFIYLSHPKNGAAERHLRGMTS